MASYPLPIPPGSIVIVRHGQPALDHESSITGKEYRLWWTRYDEHGLAKGQTVPEKLKTCTHSIDTVFSSPLPRALETAQALPGDEKKEIRTESLFVEAPLPSPLWPFLRLPSRVWGGIARIVWCCGWSDGMETQAQARKRAHTATQRLIERARKGERVLLTGHGWFNRMLRPELKRSGWSCLYDGGDDYWSFRLYVPKQLPEQQVST